MRKIAVLYSTVTVALTLFAADLYACTGIRTMSSNGDCFRGRTMEFAVYFPPEVAYIPAGYSYTGTTPDGETGKQWVSSYSVTGATGFGLPHIIDGINEEGLTAAVFWFAHYVGYQDWEGSVENTVAPWEFPTWILGSFASVEEVEAALEQITVAPVSFGEFGFPPPLHYLVMDETGDCIVIEYIEGEPVVYDNPFGVITNSPSFDWHMTNLKNYVNLSAVNHDPIELSGTTISQMGQGSGLLGMPGDFTPPSRFIRAVIYSCATPDSNTPDQGVLQSFRLLHQFDIPLGASMQSQPDSSGNPVYDYTLWSSVSDLTRRRYYFRTFQDSQIRMIDLSALEGEDFALYPMDGTSETIEDITGYLR